MPFKTRSRKVTAGGRHTISFSDKAVISYSEGKQGLNHTKENSDGESAKISRTIEADYNFVKSELTRIILLAAMIIGLQIALKLSHLSILG